MLLFCFFLQFSMVYAQEGKSSEFEKTGTELFYSNDFVGALPYFEKALEQNPKSAKNHYFLGEINFKLERTKVAMDNYNKAIELDTVNFTYYKDRGRLKAHLKDYRGSIADFNKSLEISPDFSDALFDRALSNYQLKQYSDCISDFTRVIENNPKDKEAFYSRGSAKIDSGDLIGGCTDWSRAGELGFIKAYETIQKKCN
ncbi:MAG: tetratricopeptide repeat protein [Bacteroidetes bacterium]|nr:tetratricopeptide repeat protein [Bacteroidota bacterium]